MKITDVIDDCLNYIFEYLKMEDLFSVAMASMQLRPIAVDVFQRQIGKMNIEVDTNEICVYKNGDHIHARCDLNKLHFFNEFTFLRIFGKSTSTLNISNHVGEGIMNVIQSYVSEFCNQESVTMEFKLPLRRRESIYVYLRSLKKNFIQDLSSPFPSAYERLQDICWNYHYLDGASSILERLKHLSFVQTEDYTAPGRSLMCPPTITFTNLERLEVDAKFTFGRKWFQFFMRHKQLIKLDLSSSKRKHFLDKSLFELVESLPKLKILILNVSNINFEYIPVFLAACTTLKHLRLYAGPQNMKRDEDSIYTLFTSKAIASIKDKWETHATKRCAVFIRRTR